MGEETKETEITNRVKKWQLNPMTCQLCGKDLGYAEGYPDVWCDYCAKEPVDSEDL